MEPPVAAVHPITGGMAPTTAPTQVYNPAYNPMLPIPRAVVTGSVPSAKIEAPEIPQRVAAVVASWTVNALTTNGR
eukprot:scaffold53_cov64-Cylindrotheca_fusiformis.AAC.1